SGCGRKFSLGGLFCESPGDIRKTKNSGFPPRGNPVGCGSVSPSMRPSVLRQSLHLQGFDPEHLAEIVRGARFEHYILTRAQCEVKHERWVCGSFSVDVGHYSFPVRAIGAFPKQRLCVGFMRSLTVPTWVNGFEFGMEAMQFYPPGCELNYRA